MSKEAPPPLRARPRPRPDDETLRPAAGFEHVAPAAPKPAVEQRKTRSVTLALDVDEKVRRLAFEQDRAVSHIIDDAIRAYLPKNADVETNK